jgi:WD domain, G-beta repeat
MSENTTTSNPTADRDRFPSLKALRIAHSEMLMLHRKWGNVPEMKAKIEQLINKGRATGALLDSEEDRWAAQSLLDYWNSLLYRAGSEPPDTTLVDFDPSLSPDLSDDFFEKQIQQDVRGDRNQAIGEMAGGNVFSNIPNDVIILPQSYQPETPISVGASAEPAEKYQLTNHIVKEARRQESRRQELQKQTRKAPNRTNINRSKSIFTPVFLGLVGPAIATCIISSIIFGYWLYNKALDNRVIIKTSGSQVLSEAINVRYSPSGSNILTIGERTARLWNLQGQLLSTIGRKGDTLNAVFSPDSKLIATIELDGNINLWDYQGRKKVTLNGNKSLITGLAFSTDGKFIAAANSDKNISLWNTKGTLLSVRKDNAMVVDLIFSPDGKSILTANENGIVHKWNLFSQNPNLSF